ncbi:hypothetical protein [Caldinitratiruptor microaerophilus]|uniref:EF-hand domain-containing protein n=1 Tax=Caldinitratiruptor microaerophilus TaxID=671077 RepID=A0AA35CIN5_9FIRM|nr:hypothetical protein [Caldinitratiruptor microaerophilus]BDG59895.1 hypothetical protein caldi_09850 [Caldinitratiruptor microaerophilus]
MSGTSELAVSVRGGTAGTFSTFARDVARGRVFSSRLSSDTPLVFDPATRQLVPFPPAPSGRGPVFHFALSNQGFPPTFFSAPGGIAGSARGTAELRETGTDPGTLTVSVTGLGPLPPGAELAAWLIHDLVVPPSLDPADLAALPRVAPEANTPGQFFTVDGAPPTVGRPDVPVWNTVSVPVRAGTLTVRPEGTASLRVSLADAARVALDPRALLGMGFSPGFGGALPSGLVAAILTDVFMRPATVFPQLPLATAFPQRLAAITQAAVARFDRDGDGTVSVQEAQSIPGAFLRAQDFTRVALTVEPSVRSTSPLLPTEHAVALAGLRRTQSAVN